MLFSTTQITQALEKLASNVSFNTHLKNIKTGRFERTVDNPTYKSRVLYTKELRSYVYNPALMNTILLEKELKALFFRTFGYQGQLDFTIYPYAWLRDLPLLDFGKGAYLADNIILGTNQVSVDQKLISVGPIKIGARTIIDQNVGIGYKTTIGDDCTIGFRSSIGIKCQISNSVHIGSISTIGHGTHLGKNVVVENNCFIGDLCVVEDNIKIPFGSNIPMFSKVSKEGVFSRRSLKKLILS